MFFTCYCILYPVVPCVLCTEEFSLCGLICEPVTMVDCVRCSNKFRRISCLYAACVLSFPPTCHTVQYVTAALCTFHIIFLATSTFTFVMYINLFSHGVHWSLMNCLCWMYCLTLFYLKSRVTIKTWSQTPLKCFYNTWMAFSLNMCNIVYLIKAS